MSNDEIKKDSQEEENTSRVKKTREVIKLILVNLKENKLYLLSFLITIFFFVSVSFLKVKGEDFFGIHKDNSSNETKEQVVIKTDENLDVSKYVGIYSREVSLTSPVKLNNSCTLEKYKVLYQIKKDKSISKYIFSSCLGTIKIWSDELSYVSSNGARYIGTKNVSYLFGNKSLTELDGESYKIDTGITVIRTGNKINGLDVKFYDDAMVMILDDNLISIDNGIVNFVLQDEYKSNGGELQKKVYQSSDTLYKFIVFYNNEKKNCYTIDKDELNYKIYSISYDEDSHNMENVKEIVSRNKNDGCDKYKEDLDELTD